MINRKTTTTRKTTTPPPRTLPTTTEKGYNYPKPELKFNLPNEIINKKSEELEVPVTYLPPAPSTTQRTTTTR